jgi:hypothetical protein
MIGAIIVSGIAKGEIISLTLAPGELVAMLVLLWTGPGALSRRFSPTLVDAPRRIAELLR